MAGINFLDVKDRHLVNLLGDAEAIGASIGMGSLGHSEAADVMEELAGQGLTNPMLSGAVRIDNLVRDNGKFPAAESPGMEAVHTRFEAGWLDLKRMATLDAFMAMLPAGNLHGAEEERCL